MEHVIGGVAPYDLTVHIDGWLVPGSNPSLNLPTTDLDQGETRTSVVWGGLEIVRSALVGNPYERFDYAQDDWHVSVTTSSADDARSFFEGLDTSGSTAMPSAPARTEPRASEPQGQ